MRKWVNLPARYEYKNYHDWDEIADYFPHEDGESLVPIGNQIWRISRRYSAGQDLHHISGGILGTPRWDIPTNMIHLSRVTHKFCERYAADGFTLCAAAKIRSGEWDSARMAEIMRVETIRGWLETHEFTFPWAEELFQHIRRRI